MYTVYLHESIDMYVSMYMLLLFILLSYLSYFLILFFFSFSRSATNGYYDSSGYHKLTPAYTNVGRGYPDISAGGSNFPVVIGGVIYVVYGTSASTPVIGEY